MLTLHSTNMIKLAMNSYCILVVEASISREGVWRNDTATIADNATDIEHKDKAALEKGVR